MITSLPLVSVIVPTIGRPQYILETVQSALAQSYCKIEILISDNAPEISTRSIIGVELANRVRIIERPVRLGFAEHFNACAESASGEYIIFLSDDDLLDEDYIETMVSLMQEDQDIKACFGYQSIIDDKFAADKIRREVSRTKITDIMNSLEFMLSWLLRIGKPLHNSTFLPLFVRKSDWVRYGGFCDYPGGGHVENLLIMKLATEGKIAFASTHYYYRVYEASVGMSLPFDTLFEACELFVSNSRELLSRSGNRFAWGTRSGIGLLLRWRNALMMLARLRRIYFKKMSIIEFLRGVLRVLFFAFGISQPVKNRLLDK